MVPIMNCSVSLEAWNTKLDCHVGGQEKNGYHEEIGDPKPTQADGYELFN